MRMYGSLKRGQSISLVIHRSLINKQIWISTQTCCAVMACKFVSQGRHFRPDVWRSTSVPQNPAYNPNPIPNPSSVWPKNFYRFSAVYADTSLRRCCGSLPMHAMMPGRRWPHDSDSDRGSQPAAGRRQSDDHDRQTLCPRPAPRSRSVLTYTDRHTSLATLTLWSRQTADVHNRARLPPTTYVR